MRLMFKRHYVVMSLALFLGSLYLDVLPVGDLTMVRGMHALTMGWLGGSAWLANPLICLALMMRRNRPQLSLLLAGMALLLAAQWLPAIGWGQSRMLPVQADGLPRFLAGYYVWVGALAVYVAGQFLNRRQVPGGPRQGWLAWVLVAAIHATAALSFTAWSDRPHLPPPIPANAI